MGSRFDITVVADNKKESDVYINTAVAEISRIEKLISSWDYNSQTSEINRYSGIKPVKVNSELFELIERSITISKLTDGAFDGVSYSTTFLTHDQNIVASSIPNAPAETNKLKLQLRVLVVSKDLYEYLKSVEASQLSQKINTSNVTPVSIASNVDGGLGVFGAYKMHLIDIE